VSQKLIADLIVKI